MMNDFRHDMRSFRRLLSQQPLLAVLFFAALVVTAEANSLILNPSPECAATQETQVVTARQAVFSANQILLVDDDDAHVSGVALRSRFSVSRGNGKAPISLTSARISSELFAMLGVKPVLGRNYFLPTESLPATNDVVLISSRMWKRHFDSSLDALGEVLILNGRAHKVVGIIPSNPSRALEWFKGVDLWVPMGDIVTPKRSLEDSFIAG